MCGGCSDGDRVACDHWFSQCSAGPCCRQMIASGRMLRVHGRGRGSGLSSELRTPVTVGTVSSSRAHRGPAGGWRALLCWAPGGEAWPHLGHRL